MNQVVAEPVLDYMARHHPPLDEVLEAIRAEGLAEKLPLVDAATVRFLRGLVVALHARRILEIGMFTGYSTLAWAEALPKDGRIVTCEIHPGVAEIGRRYFAESPHGTKIDIKVGPALESLKVIEGLFDLCFIDADKENYAAYYERCLELLRPRGLILLDKMLRGGRVLNPSDPATRAVDALNQRIRKDPRVENVLLPVRDGIMLVRKI